MKKSPFSKEQITGDIRWRTKKTIDYGNRTQMPGKTGSVANL